MRESTGGISLTCHVERRSAGGKLIGMAALMGFVSFLAWSGAARAEERKGSLILTSPIYCQVFQRGKTDRADIVIEGELSDKADVIEARADLAPGAKRGAPVKWTPATRQGQGISGKFSGRLAVPAGGWYLLTVRARSGSTMIAEQAVDKVVMMGDSITEQKIPGSNR